MNWLQEAIRQYLERNGYDGLCDDECGCLKDDLVACGCSPDCCEPGYRIDYKAGDKCDCDCQGMDHWHVMPDKEEEK